MSFDNRWRGATRFIVPLVVAVLLAGCGGGGVVSGGGGGTTRQLVTLERFIVAADDVQEYRGIWGTQPSQRQLRENQGVLRTADELLRVPTPTSSTAAQSWVEAYQASAADVVTLVGHNEEGAFRFADGSSVDLQSLGQTSGPALVVISCDAARNSQNQVVGTVPEFVTLTAAVEIERRVAAAVADGGSSTTSQLEVVVDDATTEVLAENSAYRMAGGVVVVAGSVIGVSVYTIQD